MNNPDISAEDNRLTTPGDANETGRQFNLSQVSSQLTHQINDLLGAAEEPNPTLRNLLTQLQQAIEAEPDLSDAQKAQALLDVAELATAGQAIDQAHMQQLAKHSIKALQNITSPLPESASLIVACQDLLPQLTDIFEL
ncbi:hypothetical protein [Pseudanabaena sp. FACHB-2040]|uniref:hypothetical protein n=1 Tax=Pseudanabaena sp. FACHB-2040 TaxID=2692859 RepID=UPI0016849BC7|nr:hypothetical protein [Pseudanabaena sp. FACHB-2040]MBD2260233.1 hypothetical protein [Pseudanabaena sp. FACHB-2040]